jgi:MshEN domain
MNGETLHELALRYGLPVVGDLSGFSPQPEAIAAVPHALALRLKIVPLSKFGCTLTVCIANPLALPEIDAVRFHTGLRVEYVVATPEDIEGAIPRFYEDQSVEMRAEILIASALKLPDVKPARRASSLTHRAYFVGSLEGQPKYEDVIADCMKSKEETDG